MNSLNSLKWPCNLRQTGSFETVVAQISSLASLSKLLKNSSRHDSNDAEENLVNYFSIDNFQFIFITSNLISSIRKKTPSPSFSFMRKAIKFLITGGLKRQSVSGIGICLLLYRNWLQVNLSRTSERKFKYSARISGGLIKMLA